MDTNIIRNPWLGLETYTEEKIKEGYKFCGRDDETNELITLIECNLSTILYGRSGIGKSSLLEAGVFPRMRKQGYSAFWIRLDTDDKSKSYAQQVIEVIEKKEKNEASNSVFIDKSIDITSLVDAENEEKADVNDSSFLWRYMHTHEFKKDDSITCPILVFDQFEEVLLKNRERAKTLMLQIYQLISNTNIIPNDNFNPNDNYRIVISIREDYLYLLEEAIDADGLSKLQSNRFRLQPLNDSQARSIILETGKVNSLNKNAVISNAVDEKEGNKIADKIIKHIKDSSTDNTISTQIVSLVCYQMYEKILSNSNRIEKKILLSDVNKDENIDSSLSDFYLRKTSNLSHQERKFIEEQMVNNGLRKSVPISDFEENVPHHKDLFNEHIVHSYKIASNTEEQVEIIHDQIARVIESAKLEAKQELFKKRVRRSIIAFSLLILLGIISIVAHKKATSPIPFDTEYYNGKNVIWQGRPYEIKNGHLRLHNCIVRPYAFANAHEIDTITLINDPKTELSAQLEIDTMAFTGCYPKAIIFKGNFDLGNIPLNYDSITEITIESGTSLIKANSIPITCPRLKKLNINDTGYCFADKTLWKQTNEDRHILFSKRKTIYYDSTQQKRIKYAYPYANPYAKYDIAKKDYWNDKNLVYYVVTCSDSNIKKLNSDDFPRKGIVVGIDLPSIEEVDCDIFTKLYECQFVYFDNLKRITGKLDYPINSNIDTIKLPQAVTIYDTKIFQRCSELTEESFSNRTEFRYFSSDTAKKFESYFWENGIGLKKNKDSQTNKSEIPKKENDIPKGAIGYHYTENYKIVFDSDYVVIPENETNDIEYGSIKTFPKIIKANDTNGYFNKGNALYKYNTNTHTTHLCMTFDNYNVTKLYLPPNYSENNSGYGSHSYKLYWMAKYNIHDGDTVFVSYGQTDKFKRILGNGIIIREMGLLESKKWAREVKKFFDKYCKTSPLLKKKSYFQTDLPSIKDGIMTIPRKCYSTGDTSFDRPIVNKIKINPWNTEFTKRGNVLYHRGNNGFIQQYPIRSINNGEPIVLKCFNVLNNRSIHSGTYILLEADAIYPEPSLADPASEYTFLVPYGKKELFASLEKEGATVKEMSVLKTKRILLAECINKLRRLFNGYVWTWHDDGIPIVAYVLIAFSYTYTLRKNTKKRLNTIVNDSKKEKRTKTILLVVDILTYIASFGVFQLAWKNCTEFIIALFSLPTGLLLQTFIHFLTLKIIERKKQQ